MDVICVTCGEPWEHGTLHEEASARYGIGYRQEGYDSGDYYKVFAEVSAEFRKTGCKAFRSYGDHPSCVRRENERTLAAAAMYEILGDDLDGAASMFEDFGL